MKEQSKQTKIPTADTQTGNTIASHPALTPILLPITRAAQVLSANDPKRSDPIPATSPTLSPTLSALSEEEIKTRVSDVNDKWFIGMLVHIIAYIVAAASMDENK